MRQTVKNEKGRENKASIVWKRDTQRDREGGGRDGETESGGEQTMPYVAALGFGGAC